MAKHSEYFVEPHANGGWAVKLPHAGRASAVAPTQTAAIDRAKQFAPERVVHVKQRDGKFRRVYKWRRKKAATGCHSRCVRESVAPGTRPVPLHSAKMVSDADPFLRLTHCNDW